jgi:hypothetical protein
MLPLNFGPQGRNIVVDSSGRLVATGDVGSDLFIYGFGDTGRSLVVDASGRLVISPDSVSTANTHRISILGVGTTPSPDPSGNMFFEPASVKAPSGTWKRDVAVFDDTNFRDGLDCGFEVPQNYRSSPKIIPVWTSTVTSGTNVWNFDYSSVGGNGVESLDSLVQESVVGSGSAPASGHLRLETELNLTAANLSAGDTVQCTLFRDGTNPINNMAGPAIVYDVLLEYSDV